MRLFSFTFPYLLLFSFFSGHLNSFSVDKIEALNDSPYCGAAVPLLRNSDIQKYEADDFFEAVKRIKTHSNKHIWPWIFFNRFVGYEKKTKIMIKSDKDLYFIKLNGMDLYNEFGALQDFFDIWEISLKTAKDLNSPGIVVDPEVYNNYKSYNVAYVAGQLGKSEEEIKIRLTEIGQELADIINKVYPEATIWFLFTGLGSPVNNLDQFANKEYRTVTYIIRGMLEQARKYRLKLKAVCGGELFLGYCHESLEVLRTKTKKRSEIFKPLLTLYPNLYLGGTIAPWNKIELKTNWMLEGKCKNSKLKKIVCFKPLIKHLLKTYNYVWIFASMAAGYNPYNSQIASKFNRTIREAYSETP